MGGLSYRMAVTAVLPATKLLLLLLVLVLSTTTTSVVVDAFGSIRSTQRSPASSSSTTTTTATTATPGTTPQPGHPTRHCYVSGWSRSKHAIRASTCLKASPSSSPSEGAASIRDAINWFKSQPLDTYLPKEDALAIVDELLFQQPQSTATALIDDTERLVIENWDKIEQRLLDETRPISEIIGKETTARILQSVRDIENYDDDAVKSFLSTDAANQLFAKVLYDGIYEFFQQIDVFGNIVGRLPVIGPIRNQIRDETKRQLDRTVGPLIQTFLRGYTKVAVGQAAEFIASPANRKAFSQANVNLVSNLLRRPVNTLIPPSSLSRQWRAEIFDYLRNGITDNASDDIVKYTNFVYDIVGDKSIDSFVDINRVIDASPTLQKTLDRIWDQATAQHPPSSQE